MADKPIFARIAEGLPTNISPTNVMSAREWFRQAAQKVSNISLRRLFEGVDEKSFVKDINISSIGSFFTYVYDPKTKDRLPYWDTHPLIVVCEVYSDGWSGLNFHYLPPFLRARLMNALYDITIKEDNKMKVQLSYRILKGAGKFNLFKPCYKRYLTNHVTSRILFIEPSQWDMALMLPTQRFVKASEDEVYKDSRRIAK